MIEDPSAADLASDLYAYQHRRDAAVSKRGTRMLPPGSAMLLDTLH
jgi:hypothetical protein